MSSDRDSFDPPGPDPLRRRLAALRDRPVDLSRVEAATQAMLAPPAPLILRHPALLRRVLSVAASLLVLISIVVACWIAIVPKPAVAAPQLLANIHDQSLAMQHVQVASFDEARSVLAREWASGPELPTIEGVPMECCMHKIGSKVLKCVSVDVGGEKVVMVVGHGKDIEEPKGEVRFVQGRRYVLTSSNGVNMAMSELDGRWICLMGRMESVRLIELAGSIR